MTGGWSDGSATAIEGGSDGAPTALTDMEGRLSSDETLMEGIPGLMGLDATLQVPSSETTDGGRRQDFRDESGIIEGLPRSRLLELLTTTGALGRGRRLLENPGLSRDLTDANVSDRSSDGSDVMDVCDTGDEIGGVGTASTARTGVLGNGCGNGRD